jgi:hypothetical protein
VTFRAAPFRSSEQVVWAAVWWQARSVGARDQCFKSQVRHDRISDPFEPRLDLHTGIGRAASGQD